MSDLDLVPVTLHLPKRTIVGCLQLLERQGTVSWSDLTLERLVAGTINSMIPWFEQKKWIEKLTVTETDHQFGELMRTINPDDDDPELDIQVGDSFEVGEKVEAAVQARLRESALADTQRPTEPTIVADVQKPGKIDLLKVNRMDIDTLSKLAPKDVLIEKVVKGIGDAAYRAAVEIVYTSLSPELWGTKTAEQAVSDMLQRHEVS